MQIRLCPECGKVNDENAWNCVNCGTTLGIETLMDAAQAQAEEADLPRKRALISVSKYFKDDYTNLLDTALHEDETIIKGCDINRYSMSPPFDFGYLILTNKRLICVSFSADTDIHMSETVPRRPYLTSTYASGLTERGHAISSYAVDKIDSPLTENERSTRDVTTLHLKNLYSADLAPGGLAIKLRIKNSDGYTLDDLSFHFYFEDEAFEMQDQLAALLKQQVQSN
jgi:hypothetical protein